MRWLRSATGPPRLNELPASGFAAMEIMLDAPPGGESAAPLFHDIATYLAQRERLPVSTEEPPVQTLVAR